MPTAHAQSKTETKLEQNLSATKCARAIFIIFRYALTLIDTLARYRPLCSIGKFSALLVCRPL